MSRTLTKTLDESRSREFFEHYLTALLPMKRQWFLNQENVNVLRTDALSQEQMGRLAASRVHLQMENMKSNL